MKNIPAHATSLGLGKHGVTVGALLGINTLIPATGVEASESLGEVRRIVARVEKLKLGQSTSLRNPPSKRPPPVPPRRTATTRLASEQHRIQAGVTQGSPTFKATTNGEELHYASIPLFEAARCDNDTHVASESPPASWNVIFDQPHSTSSSSISPKVITPPVPKIRLSRMSSNTSDKEVLKVSPNASVELNSGAGDARIFAGAKVTPVPSPRTRRNLANASVEKVSSAVDLSETQVPGFDNSKVLGNSQGASGGDREGFEKLNDPSLYVYEQALKAHSAQVAFDQATAWISGKRAWPKATLPAATRIDSKLNSHCKALFSASKSRPCALIFRTKGAFNLDKLATYHSEWFSPCGTHLEKGVRKPSSTLYNLLNSTPKELFKNEAAAEGTQPMAVLYDDGEIRVRGVEKKVKSVDPKRLIKWAKQAGLSETPQTEKYFVSYQIRSAVTDVLGSYSDLVGHYGENTMALQNFEEQFPKFLSLLTPLPNIEEYLNCGSKLLMTPQERCSRIEQFHKNIIKNQVFKLPDCPALKRFALRYASLYECIWFDIISICKSKSDVSTS